eukprot:COSAG01_NODE_4935_length_4610_cov_45.500111_7_plen_252_part_00
MFVQHSRPLACKDLKNIQDALKKPGHIVTLNAGARPEIDSSTSEGGSLIKYPQNNLLETDEMCVIKAAASAVACYSPSAAEEVMASADTNRLKMKQVTAILRAAGVRSTAINEQDPNFLLTAPGGVYLTHLIDGNGCKGHAVAVDVDRKVIIDPAEKYELPLSMLNLDECCGLASICCGLYLLKKLAMPATATEASAMDVESEDDGAGVFPKGTAVGQQPKTKNKRGKSGGNRAERRKRQKANKQKSAAPA